MSALISVACSFLIAAGLLFILINVYTKYDRIFLFFGLNLIVLALMGGIDIWIMPGLDSVESKLYWQRNLHVMTTIVALLFMKQSSLLAKKSLPRLEISILLVSIGIWGLVLGTDMIQIRDGAVQGNWLYMTFYIPYVIFCWSLVCYPVFQRLKLKRPLEKKILYFQLYGTSVVVIFGSLDMLQIVKPQGSDLPAYKVFGILIYGLTSAMIFAEHFLNLIRDRNQIHAKLQTAYSDLQQSNALKELGESSAIINHEIKNYMFMISGQAQLIQEMDLAVGKGKEMLGGIVSAVERLQKFSRDVLEMSRTHIIQDKQPLSLPGLIRDVIQNNFRGKEDHFDLSGMEGDFTVMGDWSKLHQVFVNLFGNALEAAHTSEPLKIQVKITGTPSVILVSIEDNGLGCTEEQMQKMFTAFYTTKKGSRGGTGLGLSITRTIIESHGGHISLYSKNLLDDQSQHGAKFQIAFPNFGEDAIQEMERKHNIFVIREGIPDLASVIRVFQNIYVSPYFVNDVNELLQQNFARGSLTLLASAETIRVNQARLQEFSRKCLLLQSKGSLFVFEPGKGQGPTHFSEEYVLSHLVSKKSEGSKAAKAASAFSTSV